MKFKLYTLFAASLMAASVMMFQACHRNQASLSIQMEKIPALLTRSSDLGPEKEEQLYTKTYEKLYNRLMANPEDTEARLQMAELFIMEARITGEHPYYYPAALKMVNTVLESKPEKQEVLFSALNLKSSVLLSLHQFEEGLEVAQKAAVLNPYNAGIYGSLVDGNVELGHYDEAVKMADKMVSIRPDLRSYSRVSYLREIYGDIDGAIEAMDMAVKAGYPGYESTAWTRVTLGNIYASYGDLTNAEIQYKITLQERPGFPFAIQGLASVEMKKGNLENAEKLYKEAIGIIPEVSFYEGLAEVYLKTGRENDAQKTAQTIIQMMAEDEASGHRVDMDKAKVYLHFLKDDDTALKLAMNEYRARPKNIDVNLFLAKVLIARDDLISARVHLETASVTNSKNPELWLCKGVLEAKSGNSEAAAKMIKAALNANPYLEGEMADFARQTIAQS